MRRRLARAARGAASLALFVLFGAGALLLAPLAWALRRPERVQPLVRALWRPLLRIFELVGLIRVDFPGAADLRGCVIAANHPSLIDVVVFVARVPRTLYVAKRALLRNALLRAIVRATSLPDDARLPEAAAARLAAGWNVLVFPEGTRSPAGGGLHPFRRGAAQIALRAGAPVACVGVSVSRRILGKRQAPWDMGERRVEYVLRADAPAAAAVRAGESPHAAAVRETAAIRARVERLLRARVPGIVL